MMPGFYGVGCATMGEDKTRWYLGRIVKEREVVCRKFWTCGDVSLFIAIEEETQPCSS
jgi:hypothetical protein